MFSSSSGWWSRQCKISWISHWIRHEVSPSENTSWKVKTDKLMKPSKAKHEQPMNYLENHTIQLKKPHIQPVQTLREVSPLPLTPSIHYKTIIETLQRTLVPQKYFTCRLLKTGAFAVHHHHLLIFSSNRCPAIKLHATALLHVQKLRRKRSHGQGDGSSPPDGEVNDKDARYEGISPCSKKWCFKSVGDGKIEVNLIMMSTNDFRARRWVWQALFGWRPVSFKTNP